MDNETFEDVLDQPNTIVADDTLKFVMLIALNLIVYFNNYLLFIYYLKETLKIILHGLGAFNGPF